VIVHILNIIRSGTGSQSRDVMSGTERNDLQEISNWCDENGMVVNVGKPIS